MESMIIARVARSIFVSRSTNFEILMNIFVFWASNSWIKRLVIIFWQSLYESGNNYDQDVLKWHTVNVEIEMFTFNIMLDFCILGCDIMLLICLSYSYSVLLNAITIQSAYKIVHFDSDLYTSIILWFKKFVKFMLHRQLYIFDHYIVNNANECLSTFNECLIHCFFCW